MNRQALLFVFGLLVGGCLGVLALFVNPLTDRAAVLPPRDADLGLRYGVPGQDILAFTHADRLGLAFVPGDIGALWEAQIRSSAMTLVHMDGADRKPVAFATRLSAVGEETDPLLTGLIIDDDWLITLPGEGSFFVDGLTNLWPMIRDNVIPVSVLGRAWGGPHIYYPTIGPAKNGRAIVIGGTGRFAGRTGHAAEAYHLNHYSRAEGVADLVGILSVKFVPSGTGVIPD